jgi:hypothetical protein
MGGKKKGGEGRGTGLETEVGGQKRVIKEGVLCFSVQSGPGTTKISPDLPVKYQVKYLQAWPRPLKVLR